MKHNYSTNSLIGRCKTLHRNQAALPPRWSKSKLEVVQLPQLRLLGELVWQEKPRRLQGRRRREKREDFRKEYQDANPDVKSMRDIGKACGEKWKTMTYEEKVKYYDIATEKRAEFDIAMTNFTKKKESGEFDEDDSQLDDDSDFDG
ncbi:high mobility group B protein 14-like isoform X1 [Salvia hispanica]|uniref:high mobility group B protein 14-like isoform X1 n=1 Tax=Salvia hispanica TaxID=49212 RepID=UPI00200901B7|nr:high mobility group B protein 14-like isoform X1 [Salvia hispanica]XP_047939418.1 high mobility group B protein 14-like isoform X1 [Salvia hispanica]